MCTQSLVSQWSHLLFTFQQLVAWLWRVDDLLCRYLLLVFSNVALFMVYHNLRVRITPTEHVRVIFNHLHMHQLGFYTHSCPSSIVKQPRPCIILLLPKGTFTPSNQLSHGTMYVYKHWSALIVPGELVIWCFWWSCPTSSGFECCLSVLITITVKVSTFR